MVWRIASEVRFCMYAWELKRVESETEPPEQADEKKKENRIRIAYKFVAGFPLIIHIQKW